MMSWWHIPFSWWSRKLKESAIVVQMTAVDMDHVISANVTVLMDIKALTAPRVCVQFYARHMVIMVVEFVIARMAGRDQSAIFQSMSARCRLVRVTDDAYRENATATVVGRDRFVIKSTVKIQHARDMEAVYPVSASVRLAGKVMTAAHAINRSINVYQAAPTMDIMTSRLHLVSVTDTGLDTTVHRLFAA